MIKVMWVSGFFFFIERRCSPNLSLSWRLVSTIYCMHVTVIALDHVNEIGR